MLEATPVVQRVGSLVTPSAFNSDADTEFRLCVPLLILFLSGHFQLQCSFLSHDKSHDKSKEIGVIDE